VQEDAINELVDKISKEYKEVMNLELSAYVAQIEDGSSLL
jgi:galactokinase